MRTTRSATALKRNLNENSLKTSLNEELEGEIRKSERSKSILSNPTIINCPSTPVNGLSEMRIRLGLRCINSVLRNAKPPIFCSRRMTLATISKRGLNALQELCIQNIKDLIPMIKWNEEHGIQCLRISSDLFPHASNPRNPFPYELHFATQELQTVGELVRAYGHRVTMHPGQYNVVGTPDENALESTRRDLSYHAQVLDLMGTDADSILVVRVYGDKAKTIQRWIANFQQMPEAVRR
jgi:UV DNA damage endonuclease